ncbi:hypothetical protein MPER_06195, partial [Moniliophthora perniciosa FA553]
MGDNKESEETTLHQGVNLRHADDELLANLGYKSEFKREFSVRPYFEALEHGVLSSNAQLVETVAFAFSIMGVVASVSSTLSFGLVSGGHVGLVFGWLIPCLFVATVALSMAELTSSMPIAEQAQASTIE